MKNEPKRTQTKLVLSAVERSRSILECRGRELELIPKPVLQRDRAKRPRRQVKKDRKHSYSYVENVFGRQRRHQSLQPVAVERGFEMGSFKIALKIHSLGIDYRFINKT